MLAEQAKTIRTAAGLTVERMAAVMAVSPRTIMRWEGGSQAVEIPGPALRLYALMARDELPAWCYSPPEGTPVADQPGSGSSMHL